MLNTTSIVELVVALVFMFSLVAILVTQINGIIGNALNLRAKQLQEGIEGLITDPEIQRKLLSHPIINIIPDQTGMTPQQAEQAAKYAKDAVTYIPPSSFVEALISVLIDDLDENVLLQLEMAINDIPADLKVQKGMLLDLSRQLQLQISKQTIDKIYAVIYQIDDDYKVYRDRLIIGMQAIVGAIENLEFRNYQDGELIPILNGIKKIDSPHFKNALQSVLNTAKNVEEGREKLETWFDDSMNRVSEVFQRRLQLISFAVALTLALLFNIDTIYVARVLLENPELRQDVVRAAQRYEREQEAQGVLVPESTDATDASAQAVNPVTVQDIRSTAQSLLDLQLPIGWQYTPVDTAAQSISENASFVDLTRNPRNFWNFFPGHSEDWFQLWIEKILGIAITTIAAAQGAPFWFDLLRKISAR